MRMLAAVLALAALTLPASAHGRPGSLDRSFATGGRLVTPAVSTDDEGGGLAIQRDGGIVMAGMSYSKGFAVIRVDSDGAFDESFNNDDPQLIPAPDANNAFVALQPDGGITVGGELGGSGDHSAIGIGRLTRTGAIDTRFGGNGLVTLPLPADATVFDLGTDRRGGTLVAGSVGRRFAVVRVDASGGLDKGFGKDGVATAFRHRGTATGLALDRAGHILVSGIVHGFGSDEFVGARFDSAGRPDPSFGLRGGAVVRFGRGDLEEAATAVAVDRRGRAVLAGSVGTGDESTFAVARLDRRGRLDRSFGAAGRRRIRFGSAAEVSDAAVQRNGKIVLAGRTYARGSHDFGLARLLPDGRLDRGFGRGGRSRTSMSRGNDTPVGMALQRDGRIVVSGQSFPSSSLTMFALARFLGDPR